MSFILKRSINRIKIFRKQRLIRKKLSTSLRKCDIESVKSYQPSSGYFVSRGVMHKI